MVVWIIVILVMHDGQTIEDYIEMRLAHYR